jgi:glyoxylase-like metal-dependent hydrolase (beta-lactamase superfamily II)
MQFLNHRKYHNVELFKFGYSIIGKPYLSVYCYLIDDVLIDTAQSNCEEKVAEAFCKRTINKILLTHWHEDHSGNLTILQKQHNVQVFTHPFTAQKLQEGFEILPYEKFLFGKVKPYKGKTNDFGEFIQTQNHRLIPIHTPGHAIDHTVFLEPNEGWLFSGDLFVGIKIRVFRRNEQFWEQVESFKKVLQYDFEVLFCGHHPRLKDGKKLLAAKLQYFEDFGGEVLKYHQKGLNTQQIIKALGRRENRLMQILLSNDVSLAIMVEAVVKN